MLRAELVVAFQVLLRDLASGADPAPRLEEHDYPGLPDDTAWGLLRWPDGSGAAVHISLAQTAQEQLAELADQLSDEMTTQRWSHGEPAVWPECPRHPDSHCLHVAVRDHQATWFCPASAEPIAAVGHLPGR